MTQPIDLDALQAALNDHQGPTFVISVDQLQGVIARLRKAETRENRLTNSLTEVRHWFEAERKSISKGNGSQWSMWQCEEQMEEIDKALSVAAPSDSGREG